MSILIGISLSLLWLAFYVGAHVRPTGQWRNLDLVLFGLAVVAALVADGLHHEKQKLKKMGRR
jgi:hypothetical protein